MAGPRPAMTRESAQAPPSSPGSGPGIHAFPAAHENVDGRPKAGHEGSRHMHRRHRCGARPLTCRRHPRPWPGDPRLSRQRVRTWMAGPRPALMRESAQAPPSSPGLARGSTPFPAARENVDGRPVAGHDGGVGTSTAVIPGPGPVPVQMGLPTVRPAFPTLSAPSFRAVPRPLKRALTLPGA